MKIDLMQDLYSLKLQHIMEAEKQLLDATPEWLAAVNTPELREALEQHTDETRGQIERLQRCISSAGLVEGSKRSEMFETLIRETRQLLGTETDPEIIDAVAVGAGQKVEHLEIASYGELIGMARALGRREDTKLLQQNLEEERRMEAKLAGFAENLLLEAAGTEETIR